MRYFEDLAAGVAVELGTVQVTSEDIVEFGRRYDPQPFHVDVDAARSSSFGGLVASGIHTLALFMRGFVDGVLSDAASLGSPGMDTVRWPRPVRPGDTLTCLYTVESSRPSVSRPQWGIVVGQGRAENQDGETVLSLSVVNLIARRPLLGIRQ
jgi:acyl dehydratase